MRRLGINSAEYRRRMGDAVDAHQSSDQLSYYGDGEVVMAVRKRPRIVVEIIGEDGKDETDGPFYYADYFLSDRENGGTA